MSWAFLSVFRSDEGVRSGRRSLVEPDDPSQSGMVLDVPSLDLMVTRQYSSSFILTVLLALIWVLGGSETSQESAKASLESAQWVDMPLFNGRLPFSGQRRLLQSGAAMKRHRNFLIVESTRRGGLSRRHKEGWSLLIGEGFGGLPQENFQIQDVCRSDSYEFWGHFFLWKQAYFTSISCISNSYSIFFEPLPSVYYQIFWPLGRFHLIRQWHQTWQFLKATASIHYT